MNWLKRLLNGAIGSFKSDVNREIDRAIGKLQNGETVSMVVDALHATIADLLAKAKLPVPLGAILASVLMMADWGNLTKMPVEQAIVELQRLRKQVEGARL